MRKCNVCGQEKDETQFYKNGNYYRKECKDCNYAKYRSGSNRRVQEYRDTKVCSKCKCEYPATTEYFYADSRLFDGLHRACKGCYKKMGEQAWADPAKRKNKQDRVNEWVHRNRNRLRKIKQAISSKRRAIKRSTSDGTVTADALRQMYLAQNEACAYCGVKLNYEYQIEHIVPLSRGGIHSITNICLACATCNYSKGAKTPDEWMGGHVQPMGGIT